MRVLDALGLATYHPALDWVDETGRRRVFAGLDEFCEHLGGELTVLLLQDLGHGVNVHHMDETLLGACIEQLRLHSADHPPANPLG
jgi:3-dehydroquinate synthase